MPRDRQVGTKGRPIRSNKGMEISGLHNPGYANQPTQNPANSTYNVEEGIYMRAFRVKVRFGPPKVVVAGGTEPVVAKRSRRRWRAGDWSVAPGSSLSLMAPALGAETRGRSSRCGHALGALTHIRQLHDGLPRSCVHWFVQQFSSSLPGSGANTSRTAHSLAGTKSGPPDSRRGSGESRSLRLARKLAVALWRYVETGLVPEGAIVDTVTAEAKAAMAAAA